MTRLMVIKIVGLIMMWASGYMVGHRYRPTAAEWARQQQLAQAQTREASLMAMAVIQQQVMEKCR